jgi:hypothetical protein
MRSNSSTSLLAFSLGGASCPVVGQSANRAAARGVQSLRLHPDERTFHLPAE